VDATTLLLAAPAMNYELTAGFSPFLAGCPSAGVEDARVHSGVVKPTSRRHASNHMWIACTNRQMSSGWLKSVSPARRRIWLNTLLPPLTLFATA
jgi:hypothetical protein